MSMPSGSTFLRITSLLALLCAPACGEDDDDSSSATEGTGSSGSGEASSASATNNTTAGTNNTTAGTSTTASTSTTAGTSTTTGGGEACYGDWTLGSVPFSGDPTLGQACDGSPPKNCADGTYINFATGECVCIAMCSSLGVDVGQNCTQDGQWVCQNIEATNASMNSAKACVNKDWNLCTMGGSGGTTGGGTTTSGGTTDTTSTSTSGSSDTNACTPSGGACTFSDECCSQSCDFDVCA